MALIYLYHDFDGSNCIESVKIWAYYSLITFEAIIVGISWCQDSKLQALFNPFISRKRVTFFPVIYQSQDCD